jgi:metal-responsive CopG/Arc/MetJ family transcriptional regulator
VNRSSTVVVRLKPDGLAAIDAHAEAEGVNRSEMVRRLLSEALTARQRKRRQEA